MINRKTILFASLLTAMTLAASYRDIGAYVPKSCDSGTPHISDGPGVCTDDSGNEPQAFPGLS